MRSLVKVIELFVDAAENVGADATHFKEGGVLLCNQKLVEAALGDRRLSHI